MIPSLGAIEPGPKIDGWQQAAMTLQENTTHKFNCQAESWNPHTPPLLTWYLNGEKQREPSPNHGRLLMTSQTDSTVMKPGTDHNSTFALHARKWDKELVCVASNPRTGKSYNATVTLNIQCACVYKRLKLYFTVHSIISAAEFSFSRCAPQFSPRSSGSRLTTARPLTPACLWSSSLWSGPILLPPSRLWTSLVRLWPTPLTSSSWTLEATPG